MIETQSELGCFVIRRVRILRLEHGMHCRRLETGMQLSHESLRNFLCELNVLDTIMSMADMDTTHLSATTRRTVAERVMAGAAVKRRQRLMTDSLTNRSGQAARHAACDTRDWHCA